MMKPLLCALFAALAALSLPAGAEDAHEWAIDETPLFDFLGSDEIAELQKQFETGVPSEMRVSTEYGMGRPIKVFDETAIRGMYDALSGVTVVAGTDVCTTDSDFNVAFLLDNGRWAVVSFEGGSLLTEGERYVVEGADDFWKQYYSVIDSSILYFFSGEDMDVLRACIDDIESVYVNGEIVADADAAAEIVDAFSGMSCAYPASDAEVSADLNVKFVLKTGESVEFDFSGNSVLHDGAAYPLSGSEAFFAACQGK